MLWTLYLFGGQNRWYEQDGDFATYSESDLQWYLYELVTADNWDDQIIIYTMEDATGTPGQTGEGNIDTQIGFGLSLSLILSWILVSLTKQQYTHKRYPIIRSTHGTFFSTPSMHHTVPLMLLALTVELFHSHPSLAIAMTEPTRLRMTLPRPANATSKFSYSVF